MRHATAVKSISTQEKQNHLGGLCCSAWLEREALAAGPFPELPLSATGWEACSQAALQSNQDQQVKKACACTADALNLACLIQQSS